MVGYLSMSATRLLLLSFSVLAFPAYAEAPDIAFHQATTTPTDARYEIVQSALAARWTFRLDRFSGNVDQLVTTPEHTAAWQKMPVARGSPVANPDRPRFVIFTSGLAARHTFLLDTKTGQTWVLTSIQSKGGDGKTTQIDIWEQFED